MIKIANPIYDVVFKYLMDNEEIARSILSIILGTKIVSLQSKPQETIIINKLKEAYIDQEITTKEKSLVYEQIGSYVRYDFKAVITDETGKHKTVLIELQKYKGLSPVERFREYLASNYMKSETVTENGKTVQKPLPIITIYILGYKITKSEVLAFKLPQSMLDIIWNEIIPEEMPDFVGLLSHESIFLQPTAQPSRNRGTRLEKFLTFFVQKLKDAESNFIIEIPETKTEKDEEIDQIIKQLHKAAEDEKIVRVMKAEEHLEKSIKDLQSSLKEAVQEVAEAKQKEAEAKQKEAEAKQKEAEAKQKAEEAIQTAEAVKQKLLGTAKLMKTMGLAFPDIAEATGLSTGEIEKL